MSENETASKRSVVRAMRDDFNRVTFISCRFCGEGFQHRCQTSHPVVPPAKGGAPQK